MSGDNPQQSGVNQTPPDAGQWQYKPEDRVEPVSPQQEVLPTSSSLPNAPQEVTWTASEFVAHAKGMEWYLLLFLVAVLVAAAVWLLTKDYFSVAVIMIVAVLLGVSGGRKPRVLEYSVDQEGVEIAGKFYPYGEFRSFSVMPEGAFASIMFVPLKRFGLPISVYYAPDDEEKIVSVIAAHLPLEPHEHDMIDRFAKRIRF